MNVGAGVRAGSQLTLAALVLATTAPAMAGALPPVSRAIWPPSPRGWFQSEGPSTPERAHGFVAGGVGFLSSRSLVNAWLVGGWTATGGVELPVSHSWTLVPRAHVSGGSGNNAGQLHWLRAGLDGRISHHQSYTEAGLGMSVLDGPVSVTNPDFTSHLEQRWSGAPFFQAIGGLRGDPDQGPAFMIEFTGAFGLGVERPVALELVAGVEF